MRVKAVNSAKIEEFILMGMITSTELLTEIKTIKPEYFTSSYTQTVCDWILKYFKKHGKAPEVTISSIFNAKKAGLDKEEEMVILKMFQRIEEQFSIQKQTNSQYLIDEAKKYFEKREMEVRIEKVQGLLSMDKVKEAKEEFEKPSEFSSIFVNIDDVDPLSPERVEKALSKEEEYIFKFPGAVGEIIGDCKRKWTIAFQAPMKRGKSQMLYEGCFLAATDGLKNIHVSLEMNDEDSTTRWAKRITARDFEEGPITFPTFDCILNQKGICENKHRIVNSVKIIDEKENSLLPYSPEIEYTPCTFCRKHPKYHKLYQPAVWYYTVKKPSIREKSSLDMIEAVNYFYRGNIVSLTYPKYSVTILDVYHDIENFIIRTGYNPDIIWFDYWDITRPIKGYANGRDFYDETWKIASGFAQELNVLQFGATQASRASLKKYLMEEDDTTEDIRKLAHIDALFSLNQSREEKRMGIMRLGALVHRHRKFDININAMMLQQLDVGQVILDSEKVYVEADD